MGCYHPDWADTCSCAGNQQLCEASSSGASWLGYQGQCDGPSPSPVPTPPSPSPGSCTAPNSCYHPDWADPCSCAGNQQLCEASSSGAYWLGYQGQCDGLEEEALEPVEVDSASLCNPPDNCYHPDWADMCSCAGNQQLCEASSSGASW